MTSPIQVVRMTMTIITVIDSLPVARPYRIAVNSRTRFS
jgi:hypothetical protein